MEDIHFDYERRKQRALERFGTCEPCCALCGHEDWRCLELHHVADQGGGTVTVALCANCHRIISDRHKDHPRHADPYDPLLNEVGRFLLGFAELLKIAAERLTHFGRELIERARAASEPREAA